MDSTHVFVAHLKVKGNDQLCSYIEKLLMDPTMLNVMANARLLIFFFQYGCLGTLSGRLWVLGWLQEPWTSTPWCSTSAKLRPGETIDGIQHPSSDVCSQPKCKGPSDYGWVLAEQCLLSRKIIMDVIVFKNIHADLATVVILSFCFSYNNYYGFVRLGLFIFTLKMKSHANSDIFISNHKACFSSHCTDTCWVP